MIFIGIAIGIFVSIVAGALFVHIENKKLFERKKLNFENGISIELKECPHCGGNFEMLVESNDNGENVYAIRCNALEGGCGSQTGFYTKSLDAVLAWNTRSGKDD